MVAQVIFLIVAAASIALFSLNVRKIIRNINLGKNTDRSDKPAERLAIMFKVAFGQSKMVRRPIAGFLHIVVYIGFVVINIEVLEIIIDGITGSHRFFSKIFNTYFYNFLIASLVVLSS